MVQFDMLPPPHPHGNSLDKSSPSGPVGNCLKRSYPGGSGGGANKKYLLFGKYVSFLAQFTWHDGYGPQDYVFLRKNAGVCRRVVGEE